MSAARAQRAHAVPDRRTPDELSPAQTRRRRHLEVVRDSPPEPSSSSRALGALIVLLFAALFGMVVYQAMLVQTQNQIDVLNAGIAEQQLAAKRLRLAVAEGETPERITGAAENRLGMVFPDEVPFIEPSENDASASRWDPTEVPSTTVPPTSPTTYYEAPPATYYEAPPTTPTTYYQAPPTTPTTYYQAPTTTYYQTPPTTPTTYYQAPTTTYYQTPPTTYATGADR